MAMLEKEIKIHPANVGGINGLFQDGSDTPLNAQTLFALMSEAPIAIHGIPASSEYGEVILGDVSYLVDLGSKEVSFSGDFGWYKAENSTDPLVKVES